MNSAVEGSAKLWRYFSLPKLLHLIQNDALYFARIDQFDDPFEGFPTTTEYEEMMQRGSLEQEIMDITLTLGIRSLTYVNCWSQFDFENASMWSTYGNDSGGVLVQTCFDKLRHALPDYVMVSMVRYVSDNVKEILSDLKDRAFRKLQCFSHEMEVRAAILDDTVTLRDALDGRTDKGKVVPIKFGLKNLVERIVIQPTAPTWIYETVESVLLEYGISGDVLHRSTLTVNERPWYKVYESLSKPDSRIDRPISQLIDTDKWFRTS